MKRNLILVLALLLLTFNSYSQWVLTRQDFPLPGDHIWAYNCDTSGVIMNPGLAGANVIWDFSMLQLKPNPSEYAYSTITQGVVCNFIQGNGLPANLRMNLVNYSYNSSSLIDSVSDYFVGSYQYLGVSSLSITLCLVDPQKTMKFPLTYGDTLADLSGGFNYYPTSTEYQLGSVNFECDGWGQLILPWANYDSALRVHGYSLYKDSILNVGIRSVYSSEYFNWYVKSHRGPALTIVRTETRDSNNIVVSTNSGVYVYSFNSVLGVDDQEESSAKVMVYPNPFVDKLNVNVEGGESSEIIIYDLMGRKMLQQEFTSLLSLDMEMVSSGVYFYQIRCGTTVCKQGKLVKD
jgi:Secretion system C-terminal sorting domain